jgi:predicted transcriptional regulator of viral defense system
LKPLLFFEQNPIFRFDRFRAAHAAHLRRSPATTASILKQHVKTGRLVSLRRGVYAVVPRGRDALTLDVDRWLLAAHLAPDAVMAYHSALEVHGRAATPSTRVTYLTVRRGRQFRFRGADFVPVLPPPPLRPLPDRGGGIEEVRRQGLAMRVTTLDRTLVDVLDAPRYGGGWEEIWQSLDSIAAVNLDFVVLYAIRLGSALTVARVGVYLERRQEALGVTGRYLDALRRHVPRQSLHLDRRRESGRLVPGWNLIVPGRLLDRPQSLRQASAGSGDNS